MPGPDSSDKASEPIPAAAPHGTAGRFLRPPWAGILLLILVFLVWGHTLRFGFVWDDVAFIEELQSIRSLRNIPSMFVRMDAITARPADGHAFRPLRAVMFAVLTAIGGGEPRPWIFHLNNVLWHGVAVLLLLGLFRRLLAPAAAGRGETGGATLRTPQAGAAWEWAAFLAALAWAVHPVTTEVVCWAKAFDDILAAACTFAATLLLLDWPRKRWAYPAALVLFAAGLYAKVSAAALVLFIPLLFAVRHRLSPRENAVRTLPFAAVLGLFLLHRYGVLGRMAQSAPLSGTYAQTMVDMLPVGLKYLRLLLGIPPFYIDYTYMKGGYALTSPAALAGGLAAVLWLGCTVTALRSSQFRNTGLGLAWLGLFLLPVANIVPMMQYMAERFLYLPLAGALLAGASILVQLREYRRAAAAGTLAVIAVWTATAVNRSMIWKDNVTLFLQSALQPGFHCRRVENNAVSAVLALPDMKRALHVNSRAGAMTPEDWKQVLRKLDTLQRLFPKNAQVRGARGIAYARLGHTEKAIPELQDAIRLDPHDGQAWANLARLLTEKKRRREAKAALLNALQNAPNNPNVQFALALYYEALGRTGSAVRICRKLLRDRPGFAGAKALLARAGAPGKT